MEEKYYRIYARLNRENQDDRKIIKKIEGRNHVLYPSVSSYILHAIAAFGEEDESVEKIKALLEILADSGMEKGKKFDSNEPTVNSIWSEFNR